MDVRTLMHQAVLNHSERECVAHGQRRLTFSEAWRRGVQLANGLLAMGMHMLSPVTISLPIKLLLFVMVDGWHLIMKGLILGYL